MVKATLPFYVPLLAVLMLITIFPGVVLFRQASVYKTPPSGGVQMNLPVAKALYTENRSSPRLSASSEAPCLSCSHLDAKCPFSERRASAGDSDRGCSLT